ncbi:hypothetical protein [Halomicronema sp. CCY15110]|uniref:hypothetical protein n=1 Tax=Halomicronema sp. CCY15110 TaxID=2767773 RepID=UPI0019519A8F|nr:hypothetical protein [Halomicronema sp. CCY15110]
MTTSQEMSLPRRPVAIAPEYLEAYAEADAQAGQPNPRFKQSKIYTHRYLAVRMRLVDFENLTDTELDLMIF